MAIKCLSSVRTGIVNSSFLVHVLLTFLAWMFTPVWKFKKKNSEVFWGTGKYYNGRERKEDRGKGKEND